MDKLYSGKVRDIYDAGHGRLLMVASDRISAFDVIMGEEVPDKGRVLTALSVFWFEMMADLAPNHLITAYVPSHPGRAMLCRKADMLPIECIVRGYLAGSALKEYRNSGQIHGLALPDGLVEASALGRPVFTPSTKAASGHDQNISYHDAVSLVGSATAARAREICLEVYERAASYARARGIIIADTKFELGFVDGELAICDELLTPDSSRFWPVSEWRPGQTPPSYDKQPVRDYLESTGWDKQPPPPPLPPEVVRATRQRYIEGYERLTGRDFADWPG